MNNRIKISVIIPVYNIAHLVARAVDSVLLQEYDDYEIIIVDDGSTDDTVAVCEELASHDTRIRIISKENGGVSSARNVGIEAAHGEYVMFLDADDAIHTGALEKMYVPGLDLVVAGFQKVMDSSVLCSFNPSDTGIYDNDEEMCDFFDNVIARKHCYLLNSSCFKLFRRSLLSETGLRFDEGLDYGEDKMFVMNFLRHVKKARTVSSVLYSYIIQPGSLSSDETSDVHLGMIDSLLESYVPVLNELASRYEGSDRLARLYHTDVVGRYVFRFLTQFVKRKSGLLTDAMLKKLYGYMSKDRDLGLFTVRPAQIPNYILFRIGNVKFSQRVYNLLSRR